MVIESNRSAIVQRLANQQDPQICRVQPRTPPLKHPMAVGTDQGKVIDCCDVLILHFRDGECVVCFDETFAMMPRQQRRRYALLSANGQEKNHNGRGRRERARCFRL
jgi:hypothetical protein